MLLAGAALVLAVVPMLLAVVALVLAVVLSVAASEILLVPTMCGPLMFGGLLAVCLVIVFVLKASVFCKGGGLKDSSIQ